MCLDAGEVHKRYAFGGSLFGERFEQLSNDVVPWPLDRFPVVSVGLDLRQSFSGVSLGGVRHRWVIWFAAGLLALFAVGYVVSARGESQVKRWCRDRVQVGEDFLTVPLPPQGHLISVKDGVWTYDGGVVVTVVDGQVVDKKCG